MRLVQFARVVAVATLVAVFLGNATTVAPLVSAPNNVSSEPQPVKVYTQSITSLRATSPPIVACKDGLGPAVAHALDATMPELCQTMLGKLMKDSCPKDNGDASKGRSLDLGDFDDDDAAELGEGEFQSGHSRSKRSTPVNRATTSSNNQQLQQQSLLNFPDEATYVRSVLEGHKHHAASSSRTKRDTENVRIAEIETDVAELEPEALRKFALTDYRVAASARQRAAGTMTGVFALLAPLFVSRTTASAQPPEPLAPQRRGRALMEEIPVMEPFRKPAEPALVHLMSRTALKFLSHLMLPSKSKELQDMIYVANRNIVDAFCVASEFAFTSHEPNVTAHMCPVMNAVLSVMGCRDADKFDSEPCKEEPMEPYSTWLPNTCTPQFGEHANEVLNTKTHVPQFNFTDLRKKSKDGLLPMKLSKKDIDDEGLEHFFLFRATQAANSYTSRNFACNKTNDPIEDIIPGWKLSHVVAYRPEGLEAAASAPAKSVGLFVILKLKDPQPAQCKFVIVIRGTSNQFEWFIDGRMSLVDFIQPGTKVHSGFYQLASSVYVSLQNALFDLMRTCSGEPLHLVVTGHSLGGAMVQVVSVMLANTFPEARIDAVAFATPNVFNDKGLELYRRTVNGRNFVVDLDPIGAMPCDVGRYKHGHYQCNGVIENGGGWAHYVQSAARYNIRFSDAMKHFPGLVNFIAQIKSGVTINMPPAFQMGLSHLCAYACTLSRYCVKPGTDAKNAWQCTTCPAFIESFAISLS